MLFSNSCFALIATALLFLPFQASTAQESIAELMETAGLSEGPAEMRTISYNGARIDPKRRHLILPIFQRAISLAPDAGAIIGFCNEELLSAGRHVTWIQIYTAGVDRCLASTGMFPDDVVLSNMQKMLSPVIAEHAIALMLALTRKLPAFADGMEDGTWMRERRYTDGMTTVQGKTMLVLGLGGIGTEIAQRAAALGMRVVATRNSSRSGPDFVAYVGLSDEMFDLARDADVIVNALPLTDATRGLLGTEFFASDFSRQPYFINVGRGATVDTQALSDALERGRLAGAGLDVTDPEPLPPDNVLWRQHNVIITPHVSARGGDWERPRLLIEENIRRYLAGDALLNVVDPARGY